MASTSSTQPTNTNSTGSILPNASKKRRHEYAIEEWDITEAVRVHTTEPLDPRGRVLQTWTPCRGPTCRWYNKAHFGLLVRLPSTGQVVSANVHQGPACADRRDAGGGGDEVEKGGREDAGGGRAGGDGGDRGEGEVEVGG